MSTHLHALKHSGAKQGREFSESVWRRHMRNFSKSPHYNSWNIMRNIPVCQSKLYKLLFWKLGVCFPNIALFIISSLRQLMEPLSFVYFGPNLCLQTWRLNQSPCTTLFYFWQKMHPHISNSLMSTTETNKANKQGLLYRLAEDLALWHIQIKCLPQYGHESKQAICPLAHVYGEQNRNCIVF